MKKTRFLSISILIVAFILLSACTTVRPGQVGLKQRVGKLMKEPLAAGAHWFNPFVTKILIINIRTVEIFTNLPLPTKEGLSVQTEITLLYHVDATAPRNVYVQFGTNYEEVIVKSNFVATAREVSSRYYAKELYAIEREKVEKVIAEELSKHISDKGFVVDAVLLKDIILPVAMSDAIQNKVNAEQSALQMEFVIQKQKKEAERLCIEAEGIRRSQQIIDSSLTPQLIEYYRTQNMKGLITSPNAKVIITDGNKQPFIIGEK